MKTFALVMSDARMNHVTLIAFSPLFTFLYLQRIKFNNVLTFHDEVTPSVWTLLTGYKNTLYPQQYYDYLSPVQTRSLAQPFYPRSPRGVLYNLVFIVFLFSKTN